MFTPQNTTKSLMIIITHNSNIRQKKNIFTYHSYLKYFSGFTLNIDCKIIQSALPQSSAGIGNTLNIAKANEIIAANAK